MQSIESINNLLDTGKGNKVSMLIENSMGAIVLRHITLHQNTKVFLDDTATFHIDRQTPRLNLYYAQKGCRKVYGSKISQNTMLTLALSWQTIQGMESSAKSGIFTRIRRKAPRLQSGDVDAAIEESHPPLGMKH